MSMFPSVGSSGSIQGRDDVSVLSRSTEGETRLPSPTVPLSSTSTISDYDRVTSLGFPLECIARITRLATGVFTFLMTLVSRLFGRTAQRGDNASTSSPPGPVDSAEGGSLSRSVELELDPPQGAPLAQVLSAPNLREGLAQLLRLLTADGVDSFRMLDATLFSIDRRIRVVLRAQMQRVGEGAEAHRLRMAIAELYGTLLRNLEELAGIYPSIIEESALGTLGQLSEDDFLRLGGLKELVVNHVIGGIDPDLSTVSLDQKIQRIISADPQQVRQLIRAYCQEISGLLPVSDDSLMRAYQEQIVATPVQQYRLTLLRDMLRTIEHPQEQIEVFLPLLSEQVQTWIRSGLDDSSFLGMVEALCADGSRLTQLSLQRIFPQMREPHLLGGFSALAQGVFAEHLRRLGTDLSHTSALEWMQRNPYHANTLAVLQAYNNAIESRYMPEAIPFSEDHSIRTAQERILGLHQPALGVPTQAVRVSVLMTILENHDFPRYRSGGRRLTDRENSPLHSAFLPLFSEQVQTWMHSEGGGSSLFEMVERIKRAWNTDYGRLRDLLRMIELDPLGGFSSLGQRVLAEHLCRLRPDLTSQTSALEWMRLNPYDAHTLEVLVAYDNAIRSQ